MCMLTTKCTDVDQNGYLGAPDLVKCFKSIGEDLEDALIDSMLGQIDADGDGQISLAEFRGLIKTLEKERGGLRPRVVSSPSFIN